MTSSGRSISASGSRRCRDRLHVLCWRYRGGIIGRIVSRRSRVAGASGSLRGPSPFTRLLPAPPGAAPRRPSPSRGAQPQSQRRQRAMRSARACARASPRLAECARRNQRAGRSERGPHSRVAARAAPAAIRKRVSEKRKNRPARALPVRRGETESRTTSRLVDETSRIVLRLYHLYLSSLLHISTSLSLATLYTASHPTLPPAPEPPAGGAPRSGESGVERTWPARAARASNASPQALLLVHRHARYTPLLRVASRATASRRGSVGYIRIG